MRKWIRSGDNVLVIAGNDKGKVGQVLAKSKERILVKGINVRKKHMKPQGQNKLGQILEIEKPVHISNVRLYIEAEPKEKVKLQINEKGEKELVYQSKGKTVVYRNTLKPAKKIKKDTSK